MPSRVGANQDAIRWLSEFHAFEAKLGDETQRGVQILDFRTEEDGFERELHGHVAVYRRHSAQEESRGLANGNSMQTRTILAALAGLGLVVGGVRFSVEGARTGASLGELRSGSAAERVVAVQSLIARGVLFDALQGGAPPAIRLSAIATLKEMAAKGNAPQAFDELVLLLKDPDTEAADSRTHPVRDAARAAIAEVGAGYPKQIVDAAKNPDTNIRTQVREALKPLAGALKTEMAARLGDKDLRQPMGELLALSGQDSVALVLPWLSPEKLGGNGDADVVPAKIALAEALGRFKSPVAAKALLPFLDDSDPNVRRTAVAALSNIADPSTTAPLIAAARSRSTDGPARAAAAAALGAIATRETAAALSELLRDPDTFVAAAAATGMRRAGSVCQGEIVRALSDPDPTVRRLAADAAGGLADPAPAIDALGDGDAAVRATAARSIGDIAVAFPSVRAKSIVCLTALLGESDGNVSTTASEALGRLGTSAISALIPRLGDNDSIAHHAANALSAIGRPAVPALIQAVRSPRMERWAVVALGEIGDPAARATVAAMVGDSDPDTDFVARAALAKLGNRAGG